MTTPKRNTTLQSTLTNVSSPNREWNNDQDRWEDCNINDTDEFTENTIVKEDGSLKNCNQVSNTPYSTLIPNRFPVKIRNSILKSNVETLNEKIMSKKSTFVRNDKNRRSEPPISVTGKNPSVKDINNAGLSDDSVSEVFEKNSQGEIVDRTPYKKTSTFKKKVFSRKKMGSLVTTSMQEKERIAKQFQLENQMAAMNSGVRNSFSDKKKPSNGRMEINQNAFY